MTVTKVQLLSTGAAVRHAGLKPADVKTLTFDEKRVDPEVAERELVAFEKAIDEAEAHAKEVAAEKAKNPSVFARATAWTRDNVVTPTTEWTRDNVVKPTAEWTNDNVLKPTGDWVRENAPAVADATNATVGATTAIALSHPEDLTRRSIVKIETKDGRSLEIPVLMREELLSQIMQSTSATVGTLGLFPFFGNIVQGGTGLVAGVASGASYLFGDKELGGALFGMAKKHLVCGLVGFVPVVGAATSVQAVADIKRLTDDVKIFEVAGP